MAISVNTAEIRPAKSLLDSASLGVPLISPCSEYVVELIPVPDNLTSSFRGNEVEGQVLGDLLADNLSAAARTDSGDRYDGQAQLPPIHGYHIDVAPVSSRVHSFTG